MDNKSTSKVEELFNCLKRQDQSVEEFFQVVSGIQFEKLNDKILLFAIEQTVTMWLSSYVGFLSTANVVHMQVAKKMIRFTPDEEQEFLNICSIFQVAEDRYVKLLQAGVLQKLENKMQELLLSEEDRGFLIQMQKSFKEGGN
jgi:hypothetical protein